MSSVLVARDGYGDMAVSNAIGSNVFDIDLGLGFPFLISSLIRNFEPVHILSKEEQVSFCFSLLVISVRFLLIIVLGVLSNCTVQDHMFIRNAENNVGDSRGLWGLGNWR